MRFATVRLYQSLTFGSGTSSKTYREDSFHRPKFSEPASSSQEVPTINSHYWEYTNVTPRKGHELEEMELPESLDILDPMYNPYGPEVVCI